MLSELEGRATTSRRCYGPGIHLGQPSHPGAPFTTLSLFENGKDGKRWTAYEVNAGSELWLRNSAPNVNMEPRLEVDVNDHQMIANALALAVNRYRGSQDLEVQREDLVS